MQLLFGDFAEVLQEAADEGGLARVDVADDDDREGLGGFVGLVVYFGVLAVVVGVVDLLDGVGGLTAEIGGRRL